MLQMYGARTKKSRRDTAAWDSVRSGSRGPGWTERPSWKGALLHDHVGHAAEHEDGGDRPQNDDRHNVLLWLASLVGADLDGLHPGFGFRLRLVDGAGRAHDGRCGHRRLLIDDGALLGRGVLHDVELGQI